MIEQKKTRIGLALSGGGAKGGAHLGILQVLEEEGIKISRIVGVSSGSIIGAAYCLGKPIHELIEYSNVFKKFKLLGLGNINFFGDSVAKSKKLEKIVKGLVGDATFQDCKIPFEIICVDLEEGSEVVINEGPLLPAIMASTAIPGLFSARFFNNKYLADGGILNNMPVNHVRKHQDIDIVIGIDPGFHAQRQFLSGLIWEKYYKKPKSFKLEPGFFHKIKVNYSLLLTNIIRSIDLTREESQKNRVNEGKPDLIIYPNTEDVSMIEFEKYTEVIEEGTKAAHGILEELHRIIIEKQGKNAS